MTLPEQRPGRRRYLGSLLLIVAALAAATFCAIVSPAQILSIELSPIQVVALTPVERAAALNNIRGTLLQGIAGLGVFIAAGIAWRQLQHNIHDAAAQREVSRQGQITERFGRAIDELKDPDITVRLGGIFTLDRIAGESERDRPAISNILAAYVRTRSPWPPPGDSPYGPDLPIDEVPPLRVRQIDVQSALTVLCRWGPRPGYGDVWPSLDMSGTDLRMSNLERGHLWRVRFHESNLANANFRGADLRGADLTDTTTDGTDFQQASADESTWWPDGVSR
jgi:hypothetical protein